MEPLSPPLSHPALAGPSEVLAAPPCPAEPSRTQPHRDGGSWRKVVCAKCSDYRAELKYDGNRPNRVCLACYIFLTGSMLPEGKEDKRRGILEKEASATPDQSVMCSFLQLTGDKWGRSGPRGWCVIPRDEPLVLYVYAAPQDTKAHTSIPLLGYQVTPGPQGDPRAFQLQQSGQQLTFKAESEELQARWVRALKRAASGWTPEGPDEEGVSD